MIHYVMVISGSNREGILGLPDSGRDYVLNAIGLNCAQGISVATGDHSYLQEGKLGHWKSNS